MYFTSEKCQWGKKLIQKACDNNELWKWEYVDIWTDTKIVKISLYFHYFTIKSSHKTDKAQTSTFINAWIKCELFTVLSWNFLPRQNNSKPGPGASIWQPLLLPSPPPCTARDMFQDFAWVHMGEGHHGGRGWGGDRPYSLEEIVIQSSCGEGNDSCWGCVHTDTVLWMNFRKEISYIDGSTLLYIEPIHIGEFSEHQ